jgi:hypothetical protein
MLLSDVTILITTFLRPGYLKQCLRDISENLPECPVSVACDDETTPRDWDVSWSQLPFDTGLTGKRNAAVNKTRTRYSLLGCDDFDFSTVDARMSILKMETFLDNNETVDVVVGRVNHREYEGYLQYIPGNYIKEQRLLPQVQDAPTRVDIGVNFFLARTDVLREIPWDETIRPIGGEHADWFLSMKEASKIVIYLPGANINTMEDNARWRHPDYVKYRRRAQEGHELFLKKRGVKRYYSFDERVV